MSMSVHVLWQRGAGFDSASLLATLKDLGFEADLMQELDGADGFWPVDIAGFRTGFEVSMGPIDQFVEDYPDLASSLQGQDAEAAFYWHSDFAQAGAAMLVSAALAKATQGKIYEAQDGEFYSIDRAVQAARELLDMARKEGYEERED